MERHESGAPRDHRISVNQNANLVMSDGTELDVVVTDLSVRGFRLRAGETFYVGENIAIGEPVIIRIKRRDDMKAEIVWASGCEAGGIFTEPAITQHVT